MCCTTVCPHWHVVMACPCGAPRPLEQKYIAVSLVHRPTQLISVFVQRYSRHSREISCPAGRQYKWIMDRQDNSLNLDSCYSIFRLVGNIEHGDTFVKPFPMKDYSTLQHLCEDAPGPNLTFIMKTSPHH